VENPALNPEGKEALRRARAIANGKGFDRADVPHILMALLDSRRPNELLGFFGAEPDRLREGLAVLTSDSDWQVDPDAEARTVELARIEAAQLGQPQTGPEHLLLGIVRQSGSMPAVLLGQAYGMRLTAVRDAVRFLNGQLPEWQPPVVASGLMWNSSPVVVDTVLSENAVSRHLPGHVGSSPLRRVVAIGQGQMSSGVLVELIALEIRETASHLYWRTATDQDRNLGSADLAVTDDVGTHYDVFPVMSSGSWREAQGETMIEPSPPGSASVVTIEVRSFGLPEWQAPPPSFGLPVEEIEGSWRFRVSLE
jgi:hypothetical protein